MRVVHVIERLTLGGPLFTLAGAVRAARGGASHALVSLLRADARAVAHADAAGIEVHSAPAAPAREALLAVADIVQVHFWNNPAIHAFLASGLPPARLLLWCHVNGLRAPQVVPAYLFERADFVAASCALSLDAPVFRTADPRRVGLLFAQADLSRVGEPKPRAGPGCNIGYVGLVDFVKLHPAFVRMCAQVQGEGLRFQACGGGRAHTELERQAQEAGLADRFAARVHAEEVGPLLESLDVFAYPLCEDNYSTAELVLQEAMAAGLPPVVFPYGGPARLVEHGRNGLMATDEADFVRALQRLADAPEERARLGAAAAADARARFGHPPLADAMARVYARLMQAPRRGRAPHPHPPGAGALLQSLDGREDADLQASRADGEAAIAAEQRIAAGSENMRSVIYQYRMHYPDDPWLRLWAGLLLLREGRKAPAALEFKTGMELGLDRPRVRGYFAQAIAP